ncbi:MAG: hypothetical protein WD066_00930 [Planctomycetaceae bacterium]
MKSPIRRCVSRSCVTLSLLGGIAIVAGCGEDTGEYVSYRELDEQQAAKTESPRTSKPSADAAAAPSVLESADDRPEDGVGEAIDESDRPVAGIADSSDSEPVRLAADPPANGSDDPDRVDVDAIAEGEPGATDESADSSSGPAASVVRESVRSPEAEAAIRAMSGGGFERANGSAAAAARLPGIGEEVPSEPREIELLVPEKTFKVEGPQNAIRVHYSDFDLLEVLNMAPVPANAVEYFPSWLNELDGRRVRVRGHMFPTYLDEGIKGFLLARDNDICCFVRTPKVYDVLTVKMREGVTTRYIPSIQAFDVVGTFRISPFSFEGKELDYLYAIEDAVVINK